MFRAGRHLGEVGCRGCVLVGVRERRRSPGGARWSSPPAQRVRRDDPVKIRLSVLLLLLVLLLPVLLLVLLLGVTSASSEGLFRSLMRQVRRGVLPRGRPHGGTVLVVMLPSPVLLLVLLVLVLVLLPLGHEPWSVQRFVRFVRAAVRVDRGTGLSPPFISGSTSAGCSRNPNPSLCSPEL